MLGLVLKTLVVAIVCLVVTDIIGALACTILDVLDLRGNSPALPYAIWFVLGVFCGLAIYNIAGAWSSSAVRTKDWSEASDARRTGTGVLIIGLLLIGGLAFFFNAIYWTRDVDGEFYVPDSEPHSIVFIVAVLGAMAMGRFMLMPSPRKPT